MLGEPLKLIFLSPFVWRPPAERSSQEAGEGLSFITLSPLPPVSPEGKKRGTTVWTSSWSGYTKPGSSLKGQNQTQPAGSTRRILGVAMFPTAIRLESPPGRAVRSGMGEQSHLILLPGVVRVGHWGSVSLRNPGWPMIFLPLSAHLTCCVCQVKLLFSEPMS